MDDLRQEDPEAIGNDPTLLLVDDDKPFCSALPAPWKAGVFR